MNVLVLGSSGIVGQHLRLQVPTNVSALFYRRTPDPITPGLDLDTCQTYEDLDTFLSNLSLRPECIVNLAGESNPDTVEHNPISTYHINCGIPRLLDEWCWRNAVKLVHVSTQAVFGGQAPPYSPSSVLGPVNNYGSQKEQAELEANLYHQTVIIRLTFVLGIRPMPHVGRKNPLESMLDGSQLLQVEDRFFSPLFARDAADGIWEAVLHASPGEVRHLGIPERWSRYEIACATEGNPVSKTFFADIVAVPHDSFKGMAPRPIDTTYSGTQPCSDFRTGLQKCCQDYTELFARAREIALFLGIREDEAVAKLAQGFGPLHGAVTEDFNHAVKCTTHGVQEHVHYCRCSTCTDSNGNKHPVIYGGQFSRPPQTDEELLNWYRTTISYIYELSVYHMDTTGFNYSGMCKGIADNLLAKGVKTVLCLGDGIGDLTLALRRAGLQATYHDLEGSRTSQYAAFRYWNQTGETLPTLFCPNGDANLGEAEQFDAICSLDYLEHCTDVSTWIKSIYKTLRPGGYLVAQNAFAIGSGAHGDSSIPCHLSINDVWEYEWDPALARLGLEQISSQWYRKP